MNRRPTNASLYLTSKDGVKVFRRWEDNIVVDEHLPPIRWKARKELFGRNTSVAGMPYIASENSEDALSWNLFRSLEKAGRLDIVASLLRLDDTFQPLYWYRSYNGQSALTTITEALRRVEPWAGFKTETDIILKGRRHLVMVESKLGRPGASVRAWERAAKSPLPVTYRPFLQQLLTDVSLWEETMRRFYQLLRHLVLAMELCARGAWPLEPHLLVIVNALNANRNGKPHEQEFAHFRESIRLRKDRTHLLTWQTLLAAIERTGDTSFEPFLDHARELACLKTD